MSLPSSPIHPASFVLRVDEPVRLLRDNQRVRIGTKALALLCLLAVDGPQRRERAADVLWGHADAANNLRVLLSRLRAVFREHGHSAFAVAEDPVALPSCVTVAGELDGAALYRTFADVSHGLDEWLAALAARCELSAHPVAPASLVPRVTDGVRSPHVVVLETEPNVDGLGLAREIAEALGLPLAVHNGAAPQRSARGAGAVRHLRLDPSSDEALVADVLRPSRDVWVVERTGYGRDSSALLALRDGLRAADLTYARIPLLAWGEARASLLRDLPFAEAAQLYLHTAGHPGFLGELLSVRTSEGFGDTLVMPRRTRAAYRLAARRTLGSEAIAALERLSVHPGVITTDVAAALQAEDALDELEGMGWLEYDGGWRYRALAARRAFYADLAAGQRRHYHRAAAAVCGRAGDRWLAAYHAAHADALGDRATLIRRAQPAGAASAGVEAVAAAPAGMGTELALLPLADPGAPSPAQAGDGSASVFACWPDRRTQGRLAWELPGEPGLLRLQIRAWAPSSVGWDLAPARPLRIEIHGPQPRVIEFERGAPRVRSEDGRIVVPFADAFDRYLSIPPEGAVSLACDMPLGLVEVTLTARRRSTSDAAAQRGNVLRVDAVGGRPERGGYPSRL